MVEHPLSKRGVDGSNPIDGSLNEQNIFLRALSIALYRTGVWITHADCKGLGTFCGLPGLRIRFRNFEFRSAQLGFKLAKADVSEMPLLEQRFGKANFSDCHLFEALVGPFLGRLPLEATGAELPDGILPRVTSLVRFQMDKKFSCWVIEGHHVLFLFRDCR